MKQRCQITTDSAPLIDDYRDVRYATKGATCILDLVVIRVQEVYARLVTCFGTRSALDRDTQDLGT